MKTQLLWRNTKHRIEKWKTPLRVMPCIEKRWLFHRVRFLCTWYIIGGEKEAPGDFCCLACVRCCCLFSPSPGPSPTSSALRAPSSIGEGIEQASRIGFGEGAWVLRVTSPNLSLRRGTTHSPCFARHSYETAAVAWQGVISCR